QRSIAHPESAHGKQREHYKGDTHPSRCAGLWRFFSNNVSILLVNVVTRRHKAFLLWISSVIKTADHERQSRNGGGNSTCVDLTGYLPCSRLVFQAEHTLTEHQPGKYGPSIPLSITGLRYFP